MLEEDYAPLIKDTMTSKYVRKVKCMLCDDAEVIIEIPEYFKENIWFAFEEACKLYGWSASMANYLLFICCDKCADEKDVWDKSQGGNVGHLKDKFKNIGIGF